MIGLKGAVTWRAEFKDENGCHEIPVGGQMLRIFGKTQPCDSSMWLVLAMGGLVFVFLG